MNEFMIKKWNDVVKEEDMVFHLGDFSWKSPKKFKERLNGTIIHIKGNHDKSTTTIFRKLFIQHGGYEWEVVHDPDNSKSQYVLCGHVHELWKIKKIKKRIIINVGVDVWNFQPIQIDSILNLIKENEKNAEKKK